MVRATSVLGALFGLVAVDAQGVVRTKDGRLRMMHISDVHFHPGQTSCSSVPESSYPCSYKNTTQLIKSIMHVEQPDFLVYTGDVIDGSAATPTEAMDEIYGCATNASLSFGASLGNHDEENTLSRDDVLKHIATLKGTLTHYGPVEGSPGNFYIDVLGVGDAAVARLVFFDSRIDTVTEMISDAQLDWFENLTSSLPPVTTLAFYHIPLQEYTAAKNPFIHVSGGFNEPVCADGPNKRIFPTLKAGNVVAGFCGHDHTNDFCVKYEGVNLCYEGSPGFTAYGNEKVKRRARITELQLSQDGTSLASVRSWKRLDAGGAVAGEAVDNETLWASTGAVQYPNRRPVDASALATLGPKRYQPVSTIV